jgi:hypothetical protein
VFSLKNPLKSRFFSIYFGAKVELLSNKKNGRKKIDGENITLSFTVKILAN